VPNGTAPETRAGMCVVQRIAAIKARDLNMFAGKVGRVFSRYGIDGGRMKNRSVMRIVAPSSKSIAQVLSWSLTRTRNSELGQRM
jgi:hypothetical protein